VTRLALAGAVATLVFATAGQLSHEGGVSAGGYAADVLPLLACWLVAAWWTRRFVPTWLLGVTGGVALRMVILGHYRFGELAFLAVALAVVGALAACGYLVTLPSRRLATGRVSRGRG
jgi:hypothetical protein